LTGEPGEYGKLNSAGARRSFYSINGMFQARHRRGQWRGAGSGLCDDAVAATSCLAADGRYFRHGPKSMSGLAGGVKFLQRHPDTVEGLGRLLLNGPARSRRPNCIGWAFLEGLPCPRDALMPAAMEIGPGQSPPRVRSQIQMLKQSFNTVEKPDFGATVTASSRT